MDPMSMKAMGLLKSIFGRMAFMTVEESRAKLESGEWREMYDKVMEGGELFPDR